MSEALALVAGFLAWKCTTGKEIWDKTPSEIDNRAEAPRLLMAACQRLTCLPASLLLLLIGSLLLC